MSKSQQSFMFKLFAVLIISGAALDLAQCSKMSIEYPGSNTEIQRCSDWVIDNMQRGDTVFHGVYNNSENTTHVWLKRDGICYDNMRPKGFDCSSYLYEANAVLSFEGVNVTVKAIDG